MMVTAAMRRNDEWEECKLTGLFGGAGTARAASRISAATYERENISERNCFFF